MRIVEFKCPHATTVVPDPHVEESDVPLKEHILENAVSGAVGVYTTLSIENGNSVSRRREELIELHTARLVRCILPIVCRETSESLYENVRDYVVMCLDAVGIEVMSESPTCMVVIVLWVALEGTTTGSHLKIERITMYVKEYTMKSIDGPNVACILGPPRKNPDIKDVLWMRDREYLEQLAPPGAADVLLCTEHRYFRRSCDKSIRCGGERGWVVCCSDSSCRQRSIVGYHEAPSDWCMQASLYPSRISLSSYG